MILIMKKRGSCRNCVGGIFDIILLFKKWINSSPLKARYFLSSINSIVPIKYLSNREVSWKVIINTQIDFLISK